MAVGQVEESGSLRGLSTDERERLRRLVDPGNTIRSPEVMVELQMLSARLLEQNAALGKELARQASLAIKAVAELQACYDACGENDGSFVHRVVVKGLELSGCVSASVHGAIGTLRRQLGEAQANLAAQATAQVADSQDVFDLFNAHPP